MQKEVEVEDRTTERDRCACGDAFDECCAEEVACCYCQQDAELELACLEAEGQPLN